MGSEGFWAHPFRVMIPEDIKKLTEVFVAKEVKETTRAIYLHPDFKFICYFIVDNRMVEALPYLEESDRTAESNGYICLYRRP